MVSGAFAKLKIVFGDGARHYLLGVVFGKQ
jgi:hypothetical protein